MPERIFSLSVHAGYACRHSGACCTAGWTIPVDARVRMLIGKDALLPTDSGACERYAADSRRCSIHHEHGEDALPHACQQFPRRALIDDRGTFVTLSHFCPTAAGMLFDRPGEPVSLVGSPAGFSGRLYEGMSARGAWPPLVRPGVLFDLPSYDRWETFLLSALSQNEPAEAVLARIALTAERLRTWTAAAGPFDSYAQSVLGSPTGIHATVDWLYGDYASSGAIRGVLTAVPSELLTTFRSRVEGSTACDLMEARFESWVAPYWQQWSEPVRRYLASKAFAAWTAYDGHGVRTLVAELFTAYGVLRAETARCCAELRRKVDRESLMEAFRAADLLLVHLADRAALVRWFNEVERRGPLQGALPYSSPDEKRSEPLQI